MGKPTAGWPSTTHDWPRDLDAGHIERIRREPVVFAAGGALHLVLEVLAYAADEAEHTGSGSAVVTVHDDGSVSVAEDGRGTATHVDDQGQTAKKPVMTTKDLAGCSCLVYNRSLTAARGLGARSGGDGDCRARVEADKYGQLTNPCTIGPLLTRPGLKKPSEAAGNSGVIGEIL
jgi:succinate dehydrogenase/fumarate reductase flavoprotein subunit